MVRVKENDENAQPCERPNVQTGPDDSDRLRFGFKKKRQHPTPCGSPEATAGKTAEKIDNVEKRDSMEELHLAPELVPQAPETCSLVVDPVDFSKLVDSTLGDIDFLLPLLKLKPTADKYNFKDRIKDLESIIQPLKDGLSDQRRRSKALLDALVLEERQINSRLRVALEEAAAQRNLSNEVLSELRTVRQQAEERGRQVQELVVHVDAAHREREHAQVDCDRLRNHVADLETQLAESQRERQEYGHALAQLKEELTTLIETAAGHRAALQVQLDEKEQSLARKDAEVERRVLQVERAHQVKLDELEERQRTNEARLAAEMQALKDAHALQVNEFAEQLRTKDFDHEANIQSIKSMHHRSMEDMAEQLKAKDAHQQADMQSLKCKHQEKLDEMEHQLKAKDMEMQASIHSIKAMHQAKMDEMEEQLKAKDADHQANVQAIKAMHKAKLEELEGQMRAQDADHQANVQSLVSMHQAQIEEKDAMLRQRDADIRENILSIKAIHQTQLEKKDDLLRQKDASMRESIQSIRSMHQAQLDEKDDLLKQRDADLRESIQSIATMHRDNNEQVMFERQRAQRLEEELQTVRANEDNLRTTAQSSAQELERAHTELSTTRQKVAELQSTLHRLEVERDKIGEACAEDKAELHKLREEIAYTNAKLGTSQEELASANALLKAKAEQADELRARIGTSSKESEGMQQELTMCRRQVADLLGALRQAEGERERMAEAADSRQAALEEELTQLRRQMNSLREELATTQRSLCTTTEKAERLSQERHVLEVEFHSYKEHHGTSNQQQMDAIADLKLTVDKLTKKVETAQLELGTQQGNISQQKMYIESLEQKLKNAEGERRELHNTIQELKGNIRVFCRVRPAAENVTQALHFPEANKINLACTGESHAFTFDKVFLAGAPQEAVFEEVAGLVQSALDGYKVCIFAYGQTGSGKTYTMQGTGEPESWGLIPRSLTKIFQTSEVMRENGWDWSLHASFFEVYNEAFRDLLRQDDAGAPPVHTIKHDDAWGTVVTNMGCHEVKSMDQITALMTRAAKQRAVGSTEMNSVSSRSHSIFALYLRGVNSKLNSELHGALHLVDLAGSERLHRSGATGDRLKETQNINRSLSSLADVFLAKSEGRAHIPFRNSKLTHLMEPCLSGHGKTLMVVNIGPEQDNAHETLCSLRFAGQVSQCDTGGRPKRSARAAIPAVSATSSAMTSRPQTPARPHDISREMTAGMGSARRIRK